MSILLEIVKATSKEDFGHELSKAVEEVAVEKGLSFSQVIKQAHELLEKQVIK
ncbi:hypothetical protein [Wukongibacter sp. M2B1]|uniref:hypothetical protein n=1 Tax=Wukongibacter sp. M2B1 TaxID=3088895 RepID=UPI003D7BBB0C